MYFFKQEWAAGLLTVPTKVNEGKFENIQPHLFWSSTGTPGGEIIATLPTFRCTAERPVWSNQIDNLADSNGSVAGRTRSNPSLK